jgi:hypothetical protein
MLSPSALLLANGPECAAEELRVNFAKHLLYHRLQKQIPRRLPLLDRLNGFFSLCPYWPPTSLNFCTLRPPMVSPT